MWKLVIEDDEGKRTVVPLTRDDYTIGRKEGNTIRLTERNVSREHAKLRRSSSGAAVDGTPNPAAYMLEDITSYNGVYVNGLRVAQSQNLVHGDLVQIGDYRMVLQDDQVVEQPTAVPSISADSKTTIPTRAMNRGSLLMERPNRLVMLAGPTPGAEFTLDHERLTIGRAEDAGISVNHNSVSRLHCEVHALGEARYEIVDKGSSNGVRVNSAELKRGIIEAGDIIELGDVKFKFVGAGQIFLPGVNDSQQLSTIGDRSVKDGRGARRGMGVVPYMVFGAVVAAGVVGTWAYLRHRQPGPAPTATITSVGPGEHDQAVLDEARKLAEAGDLEGAHERIANDFVNDTLRTSNDYREIESSWARTRLTKADAMANDPIKQRSLLEPVERNKDLDMSLRNQASEMLRKLEAPAPSSGSLGVAPSAMREGGGVPQPPTASPRPDPTAKPPPNGPTAASPAVPAPPTAPKPPPPPVKSALDRAREVAISNPDQAKSILMPIAARGNASNDEVRLLRSVCKDLGDTVCRKFIDDRYGTK